MQRRVALLERDLEALESVIESVKGEIKYLVRKMKETLNV